MESGEDAEADRAGAGSDIPAQFEKYKDAMYRVARSMLRHDDQHRADDVVQEVMLSICRNPPTDVRSWEGLLIQAVKHRIYDLWKSPTHRHESLILDDVLPREYELGGDYLGLDPAVLVEENRDREVTVARVRGALAELTGVDPEGAEVYRQVKVLGRSSQDVADEMGVSPSRVRQHVMRARKKLMEILRTSGGGL